ncbi:MAG: thioesterase domain-containing protein [Xanthomonadales bacterium]|nr:thioesterase domain-containing protein [Xanthomonadales bacterium]
MNKKTEREWLDAFRQLIRTDIPLSNAMQLEIIGYQDGCLSARAPLAPNINDKGTAFGGSQAALMTLVAWGVVWLETRKAGINCDIVIHKGEVSWLMPLDDEIFIQCLLPPPKTLQKFLRDIHLRGKAAIHLQVSTSNGKDITSEFNCRYVAIKKDN